VRSEDSVLVQSVDLGSGQEAWRSLSCLTDSTEQSAPVNFDLSNRVGSPFGLNLTFTRHGIIYCTYFTRTGQTTEGHRQDTSAHRADRQRSFARVPLHRLQYHSDSRDVAYNAGLRRGGMCAWLLRQRRKHADLHAGRRRVLL